MTIWVNKKTGATKNQYAQPMPYSEWEKKRESYSSSSDSALDILAVATAVSVFDSSPSYDSSSSSDFSGGGGDFGGGGSSGDW